MNDQKLINLQKQLDCLQQLFFKLDQRIAELEELSSYEDIEEYSDDEVPPLKKQKAETPLFQRKF